MHSGQEGTGGGVCACASRPQVYGPTAINVYQLMETLRVDGELFTIGAETALLEARDKRRVGPGGLGRAAGVLERSPARLWRFWGLGPAAAALVGAAS